MAHLSGWLYRKFLPIPSSGWSLSGDVTDFTIKIPVTSALTEFWANVKADGGDVRFTASDGTTLLGKKTVKFDYSGNDAYYLVKIPSILAASDPTIYLYAGNASASSDDSSNAFSSSVRAWFALDQNYSGGAFVDLKNGLSGTDNGTTDAADQAVGRGRAIDCTVPYDITVSDDDLLSFGDGSTDTDMSIVARVNITDATKFRICSKGNTETGSDAEYQFLINAADTLILKVIDKSTLAYRQITSTETLTADEGSWLRLIATKTGSTLKLYRNASEMAATPSSNAYVAMENLNAPLHIGSYYGAAETTGSGVIGELVLLAEVVSADWMKCYEYSSAASWLTWGDDEYFPELSDTGTGTDAVSVGVGSSTVNITDNGIGTDSVGSIAVALTIGDTGSGLDSILAWNGALYGVTDTGSGLDEIVSLAASLALSDTASGADSINVSGGVTPDVILESVHGFAAGAATEYKIVDEYQQVVQSWTSTGVWETTEDGVTSSYSVKIGRLSQYIIFWRISGTKYKARRTVNLFESNNDATTTSRLASVDYTAPDNAGVAALQNSVARLLGLALENHVEDDIVRDSSGNKTSCSLYLYDSAAHASAHVSGGGGGTGIVAKYQATFTYSPGGRMTLNKVVRLS